MKYKLASHWLRIWKLAISWDKNGDKIKLVIVDLDHKSFSRITSGRQQKALATEQSLINSCTDRNVLIKI